MSQKMCDSRVEILWAQYAVIDIFETAPCAVVMDQGKDKVTF